MDFPRPTKILPNNIRCSKDPINSTSPTTYLRRYIEDSIGRWKNTPPAPALPQKYSTKVDCVLKIDSRRLRMTLFSTQSSRKYLPCHPQKPWSGNSCDFTSQSNPRSSSLATNNSSLTHLHCNRWPQHQMAAKVSGGDLIKCMPDLVPKEELSREIKVDQFCSFLGTRHGRVCMRLRVLEEKLHELYGPEIADQHILPTSSVPLVHILDLYELKSTGKIILAYVLVKSVWQFYSSDWMNTPWSTESIHFMREQPSSTSDGFHLPEINPADPYFAFGFENSTNDASLEHYDSWYVLHQYPRILALGVLLVEICRGRSRKNRVFEAKTLEEKINNDYTSSWEAIKSSSWPDLKFRNSTARDTYRAVAEVCLSKEIFGNTGDIEERRNILRKRVVCPLGKLLEDIGLIDQSGLVKRMEEDRLSSSVVPGPDHGKSFLKVIISSYVTGIIHREVLLINNARKPSDSWLESLVSSRLAKDLHAHTKTGCSSRIKIAILDTGYDPESPFFRSRIRRNRIKSWKDWVSNSLQHQDQDGHGTHVVSLVMRIAPQADVYMARIAEGTEGLQKASQSVAEVTHHRFLSCSGLTTLQAIKWATEDCEADIVSMSFGYPEEILVDGKKVVSKAILRAVLHRDHRVLFLAAGGNFGGNQKEMFPASHEFVIPIRSTDHEGAFQGFNPPPNYRGLDVFGTLGKGVSSAWLSRQDGERVQTGTSVATPIAAGIAAMVLADARILLENNPSTGHELINRLWTKAGMWSMFENLSTQTSWKCLYICPKEFARSAFEERHDLMKHAARQA